MLIEVAVSPGGIIDIVEAGEETVIVPGTRGIVV